MSRKEMSGDDDDHAQRRVECRHTGMSVLLTKHFVLCFDWCARHAILVATTNNGSMVVQAFLFT